MIEWLKYLDYGWNPIELYFLGKKDNFCSRNAFPLFTRKLKQWLRHYYSNINQNICTYINWKTCLGTPALSAKFLKIIAVNGVSSLGFKTTVQPAARAGATFRVIIEMGKFHYREKI